jgi:hypothetical protein
MKQDHQVTSDLRVFIEAQLGKPLASSANAALWRCPLCPAATYALLWVSATQQRCLGRGACSGGACQRTPPIDVLTAEAVGNGERA